MRFFWVWYGVACSRLEDLGGFRGGKGHVISDPCSWIGKLMGCFRRKWLGFWLRELVDAERFRAAGLRPRAGKSAPVSFSGFLFRNILWRLL